ncbi:MAG TPA: PqqD family protein [Thermoleophilaceae bacterium]|jgi:hypothetical protein
MAGSPTPGDSLLNARVRVPEHVVYRDFGDETVILNLDSGMYHGLNHTAAAMLSTLGESESVAAAIDRLVGELGQPREVIQPDVLDLCHALADRGLIEHDGGD